MLRFILRRLALGIVTLWILSLFVFFGTQVLPGNPGRTILGPFADAGAVKLLNHQLGVDRPIYVQYGDWITSAFSIGRNQLPYVGLATAAGCHVRVGLEDNIWLGKGQLATNGDLVRQARKTIEGTGARLLSPAEVREKLKLQKRWA